MRCCRVWSGSEQRGRRQPPRDRIDHRHRRCRQTEIELGRVVVGRRDKLPLVANNVERIAAMDVQRFIDPSTR